MDLRDIGLFALILTWIDTLAYSIYLHVFEALPFATLQNFLEVGRTPTLFLANILLFHISIYILLRYSKQDRNIIKKIFWAYPISNILIAILYAFSIAGANGMIFLLKAPFIIMYSFITQLTIFLIDIEILPIKVTQYIRQNILIFTLITELFLYIAIRIVFGASPIITSSFLILGIITITAYLVKK